MLNVKNKVIKIALTPDAIADIVLQVGFSSQSHLTQQLKRITGVTPKQVRSSP